MTDQTLPDFVKDDFPEPKDYLWNRLFYKGVRNETAAFDYDAALIRGALQWLERPPQDKPWVLFLPLIFPHPPFTVEEPWFSLHNRSEMKVPPRIEDRVRHNSQNCFSR